MSKLHKNQSGFGSVEIILTVVIIGLLGAVGWFVYDRNHNKATPASTTPAATATPTNTQPVTPSGTLVKTTDGHAQFLLPSTWKVNTKVDNKVCFAPTVPESATGPCLIDVTYQPTAFKSGGVTFWDTKIFKTTKTPKTWNDDAMGTGPGACDNPTSKTINTYQTLVCTDSGGGTEYLISNGQYLALFSDSATGTGIFANASAKSYESGFATILASIKFN